MPQDNIRNRIFADFVKDLEYYCNSQRSFFFKLYSNLSFAKVNFARKISEAIKLYNNNGDTVSLQNLAENAERSNSILTTPSFNMFRNMGGLATPGLDSPYRTISANSNFNLNGLEAEEDNPDYYDIFWSYYHKLHQWRNSIPVGRLDGLVYAMSRTAYFLRWLEQRNINFDMPHLILDQTNNLVECSTNPTDQLYQDAVRLLTYFIACLIFDRALARFSILKSVDPQYYLDSGAIKIQVANESQMKELDSMRDSLIRYLILLHTAYRKTDMSPEEKDFTLLFLLREPEFVIPTIYKFAGHTRFKKHFEELDQKLNNLTSLKESPTILLQPTKEFVDAEEDIIFLPNSPLCSQIISVTAVCPSPSPIQHYAVKPRQSS